MKKHFAKLIVCIAMLCFVFTGCTLFETDMKSYLNQTVATTSTGYSVSMEELLTAFNSSSSGGYQYITQNGLSAEEAFEKTIDDVISKKIIIDYIDKEFDLEDKYEWRAYESTFAYINERIKDKEDIIKKEKYPEDFENEEEPQSTENTNSTYIYTEYESVFDLDADGNVIFKAQEEDEEVFPTEKPVFKYTSVGALATSEKNFVKVFEEAKREYFGELEKNYEDMGEKDLTDEQLKDKEIERLFKIYYENEKLTFLSKHFEKTVSKSDEALANLKQDIFNAKRSAFEAAQETYKQNQAESKFLDFLKNEMASSKSTITEFYPDGVEGNLFYVSHILLAFNEEDQTELSRLEGLVANGGATQEEVDAFREKCYERISIKPRNLETGVANSDATALNPNEILAEINGTINGLDGVDSKMTEFGKFVYKYNTDPGIMSTKNGYVIPTEQAKNDVDLRLTDSMVESFATTSRELRGDGAISNIGNFSGLVKTEYGYHIIMYMGEVENTVSTFNNVEDVIKTLYNTRIRADQPKTYLDLLYEQVYNNSSEYSDFIEDLLETKKAGMDVKYYKTRYKKEVKKFK